MVLLLHVKSDRDRYTSLSAQVHWEVQDNSFPRLVVDAGFGLGAQLELLTGVLIHDCIFSLGFSLQLGSAGSRNSRKRGHKLPALLKARPWADTMSFRHIVLAKQAQSQHNFKGNWNKLSLKGVVEIGHLSAYILSSTLKASFDCFLTFIVCDEKPDIKIIIVSLYVFFCPLLKVHLRHYLSFSAVWLWCAWMWFSLYLPCLDFTELI